MEIGKIVQLSGVAINGVSEWDGKGWRALVADKTSSPDEWTTTPPTEPGWYWAWVRGAENPMVVMKHKQKTIVYSGLMKMSIKVFAYWLGPLPKPEPPK